VTAAPVPLLRARDALRRQGFDGHSLGPVAAELGDARAAVAAAVDEATIARAVADALYVVPTDLLEKRPDESWRDRVERIGELVAPAVRAACLGGDL
jgi:AcrR family transcriptional regulator